MNDNLRPTRDLVQDWEDAREHRRVLQGAGIVLAFCVLLLIALVLFSASDVGQQVFNWLDK